ncbi:MAG: transketolase, partial [Flavobacteriales bacterium]
MNTAELQSLSTQVRRDIVRMVHAVQSGHPGGSLGCTDLLVKLYFDTMKLDASNFTMDGQGEDLFFLSNGHISPVWYSVLARRGYFPVHELATFRKLNTRLQGHPATEEGLPGIRVASGSLGQGLSVALGAAQAKLLNGEDTWVYSLHGDGELQEGQIWEAAMYAAHHKLDNIVSFVDCNGQQIDGSTDDVMSLGSLRMKWEAFGWHVLECDGHDFDDLDRRGGCARSCSSRSDIKEVSVDDRAVETVEQEDLVGVRVDGEDVCRASSGESGPGCEGGKCECGAHCVSFSLVCM